MIVEAAVPDTDRRARAKGDVAPWSSTHVMNADVDRHAASLREWTQVYEQMTPGRFVGSLQQFSWGKTQVFRETTSQAVHQSGGPRRGTRAFGVPVRPVRTALFRSEPVDHDTIVTLGGDDDLDFYTPRGFDILGIVVDAETLEMHARSVENRDVDARLDGIGTFKPGAKRARELRDFLLSVLQSCSTNPSALEQRQTCHVLEQSLFSAVVAAVPGEGMPAARPRKKRRQIVDEARALMQSRIADPITIADICVALGVSRRTLQYSFQDVLDINPVRFLRALRLNGVRRDLRNEATPATSVQDTAAQWGFWHLGHFVCEYKQMFGELPSETFRGKREPSVRRPGLARRATRRGADRQDTHLV